MSSGWDSVVEDALVLYREAGDRQGKANTLAGFGNITENLGQYPQSLDYYQQSYTDTVVGIYRKLADLWLQQYLVLGAQFMLDRGPKN